MRDEVSHSWDIQSKIITKTASEALKEKEGICYSKCNLLAALLRAEGIPAGFCYQRLILGDTIDTGYCIHALNAVYIKSEDRWIRLDARGNKEGVQTDFSLKKKNWLFQRILYGVKLTIQLFIQNLIKKQWMCCRSTKTA